jgi:hypothetical protein
VSYDVIPAMSDIPIRGLEHDDEPSNRALFPPRDYGEPWKTNVSGKRPESTRGSAICARNEKLYDRAFEAWFNSTPGTDEAVRLLRVLMELPSI